MRLDKYEMEPEFEYFCSICQSIPIVPTKILIFHSTCWDRNRVCLRCARNFLKMNEKEKFGAVCCPYCNDNSTMVNLRNIRDAELTYEVDYDAMHKLSQLASQGRIDPFECECRAYFKDQFDMWTHLKNYCPESSRFCKKCKSNYKLKNQEYHSLNRCTIPIPQNQSTVQQLHHLQQVIRQNTQHTPFVPVPTPRVQPIQFPRIEQVSRNGRNRRMRHNYQRIEQEQQVIIEAMNNILNLTRNM